MNWRLKALTLWTLHAAPYGNDLHFILQKRITKSLPRKPSLYPQYLAAAERRRDQLLTAGPLEGKTMLEFGAGWDLFCNIVFYCYGLDRQILVDLNSHMRPELVDDVIAELQKAPPTGAKRSPPKLLGERPMETLKEVYGIEYRAPADARRLDMVDGAVDLVATTNTLEHIPFGSLEQIMRECHRVCHRDGLVCMQIDYSDHFSHADQSITPYNFLQFSETGWRSYNPPNQYQNRRRHSDYRRMFREAGYMILDEEVERPEDWEPMLARVNINSEFSNYSRDDISITGGLFVLRPI